MIGITDYGMLYMRIGRLLESPPSAQQLANADADPEVLAWLGKADACIKATNDAALFIDVNQALMSLRSISDEARVAAAKAVIALLYRAQAVAELRAPPGMAGTFIQAGNAFDAFAGLTKVMKEAKNDLLVVDKYMDETILTEFAIAIGDGPTLRLLTADKPQNASIIPAAAKWREQHGPARPVELRLAPAKDLHDRLIIIDNTTAYIVTQSIKDIAKRSPAEIVRTDYSAAMKIEAYKEIWDNAKVP